jgi:hypothetical protein
MVVQAVVRTCDTMIVAPLPPDSTLEPVINCPAAHEEPLHVLVSTLP